MNTRNKLDGGLRRQQLDLEALTLAHRQKHEAERIEREQRARKADELLSQCSRWIYALALRWYRLLPAIYDRDDLAQEFILAFCRVAYRYDPTRSALTTYVTTICLSKLREIKNSFAFQCRAGQTQTVSLYSTSLINILSSEADDPIRKIIAGEERATRFRMMQNRLDELKPLDRVIVELTTGIGDGHHYRQHEVAEVLGVSRARIGQRVQKAFEDLGVEDLL
ncbi:hypothetical protein BH11PLA2_BH11PLA2_29190 [soil metagenome]